MELTELISKAKPGEKLPSEPDLARKLGVSRATLREAMRAFEGQGLIRRRQGVGTFIVEHTHTIESGLEVLESIETLAKRIGLDVSVGNLKVQEVEADETQAQYLVVKTGSKITKITRVIIAENRPVAYLIDLLPAKILPEDELKTGFNGSVLDWLLKKEPLHWRIPVRRSRQLLLIPKLRARCRSNGVMCCLNSWVTCTQQAEMLWITPPAIFYPDTFVFMWSGNWLPIIRIFLKASKEEAAG